MRALNSFINNTSGAVYSEDRPNSNGQNSLKNIE
jgi:hypothetical protein